MELDLPDWALGASVIRNLIRDHVHQKAELTPLNDVDLIYLDQHDPQKLAEAAHAIWLTRRLPNQQWTGRNQARMHTR
ncbi:MAG: nucleotidyltransferase family protein [Aeromonas sp.]